MAACSGASKNLNTDVGTMTEGDRLKDDEFFEEARKQYMRIKTEFPQSPLQVEADLKIAETYFLDESYPAAATAYEDFVRTYPGRPELPKALYQLGMSYKNQMPSTPQRDTKSTVRVIDVFTRLLVDFPKSEYSEKAGQYVEEARDQLAQKIYEVGRFYEGQKAYAPAARRYKELQEQYPDHKLNEEAFAREIRCLRKAGHSESAEGLSQRFIEKFPNSEFMSMIKP